MSNKQSPEQSCGVRRKLAAVSVAISISLLLMLRTSESSSIIVLASSLTRLLQQSELNAYLDVTGLIFRYGEEFLRNASTQLTVKIDPTTFGIKARPSALGRVKHLLVVITNVSVVVPTWNEERYLPRCLSSLVNQKHTEPFEIIVVDGGSTDRTLEVAEEYSVKALVRPGLPVGAARNIGARHAEGEVLAFIDADTIASEHWVNEIANAFNHNPDVVGVTGPTYPYEGSHLDALAYHVATGWAQRLFLKLGFPHVAGFNCAYRKCAFWNAKGFDEGRELSEDVLLSMRIRHEGRVLFNPEMIAYTSLRRIQQFGYAYLTTYYAINALALMLFRKNLAYPKVR